MTNTVVHGLPRWSLAVPPLALVVLVLSWGRDLNAFLLILVCAGAGGHAGTMSPFALVGEVRRFWDGPLILSGAITTGAAILAARSLGADLAYMGTRFIATREANAVPGYKQALVDSAAEDIIYSSLFSGIHGNYLRSSIVAAGMDPDKLPDGHKSTMDFGAGADPETGGAKAWRDIWGAGQGTGQIRDVPATAELVARLGQEYQAARQRVLGSPGSA